MGCIMTPMPNHLSTYLSLPLNHKTTHKRVEKKEKSGVGKGRSVEMEQMRSGVDEMVRLNG